VNDLMPDLGRCAFTDPSSVACARNLSGSAVVVNDQNGVTCSTPSRSVAVSTRKLIFRHDLRRMECDPRRTPYFSVWCGAFPRIQAFCRLALVSGISMAFRMVLSQLHRGESPDIVSFEKALRHPVRGAGGLVCPGSRSWKDHPALHAFINSLTLPGHSS